MLDTVDELLRKDLPEVDFVPFEQRAVPETTFRDLEKNLWSRFLPRGAKNPRSILHQMKLLTTDDLGEERASAAGILLCTREPETWLPVASIEAIRFRGVRNELRHRVDVERMTGPLDEQIRQAFSFVMRNMTVAAIKRPAREEFPQFSAQAVLAAVADAVACRDYSIHSSKIRLYHFADRLEIYSPGATTTDILSLRRSPLNELITFLLSRTPVEAVRGVGRHQEFMELRAVPTILEESRRISGRDPEYRLLNNADLLLTIWSAELPNRIDLTPEIDSGD